MRPLFENFLLELGDDFTFVGRQRRLRIDDEWYRVDLVFFHRRLRCLILIDLKLGKLTPGDWARRWPISILSASVGTEPRRTATPSGSIVISTVFGGRAEAFY